MKKFSFAKYLRGKKNRIGVQGLTSYGKVSECGLGFPASGYARDS